MSTQSNYDNADVLAQFSHANANAEAQSGHANEIVV